MTAFAVWKSHVFNTVTKLYTTSILESTYSDIPRVHHQIIGALLAVRLTLILQTICGFIVTTFNHLRPFKCLFSPDTGLQDE